MKKNLELAIQIFFAMYQKFEIFVKLLKNQRKKTSKQLELSIENQITDLDFEDFWGFSDHSLYEDILRFSY